MEKINLIHKKIGIWGFGIVGKSALNYVQQFTDQIQIIDQKKTPEDLASNVECIEQTPENIVSFLEYNDLIIASPGIILNNYEKYNHKFLNELDIFSQENKIPTVAITGTVGKTTITSLLQQCIPDSIAAGNIGHAMLNTLHVHPTPKNIVLELSSYQLHRSHNFSPDIAIWTNFYPNHLDHHRDKEEYFLAKCNLFKKQTPNQIALIPVDIIEKIEQNFHPQAQIFLFSLQQPNQPTKYPIFFIQNQQLVLKYPDKIEIVFQQFDQLPDITFPQNWLIIIACLYLQKISLDTLLTRATTLQPQEHRVEFVTNLNGVHVYNDSKSTVWQATKHAVERFEHENIALFLGGISKGTDRTPLIEYVHTKSVTVFAFGKEADLLENLCKQFQVPCFKSTTLNDVLDQYLQHQQCFNVLLFSPAGASFDLFANFEDRGKQFKKLIQQLS